ncbi:MAG: glycoside hydrolase family 20 zincin-like fold domain-containing protein [Desulfobacteraceae bacterium]|jgi:hypothetical protein
MGDVMNSIRKWFMAMFREQLSVQLFFSFLCMILIVFLFRNKPDNSYAVSEGPAKNARLFVDKTNGARVFCADALSVVSLAGSFELYERSLTGARKQFFTGPWGGNFPGKLLKISNDHYTISANDTNTGMSYTINYIQKASDVVDVKLTFKAPKQPLYLTFDLMKLYGDLFQGAAIKTIPQKTFDPKVLPIEPMPFNDRILLKSKNKITLNVPLFDMEVTDNSNAQTINLADFRNVPWDTKKSFYLWVDAGVLTPGKVYEYGYTIRFFAPTQSNMSQTDVSTGQFMEKTDPWSFLKVKPKEQKIRSGYFSLLLTDSIEDRTNSGSGIALAREIELRTGISLAVLKGMDSGQGISIEIAPKSKNIPAEGFEILVDEEHVTISGADERGCLYGTYALMGEFRLAKDVWLIPFQTMKDWPDLPVRSIEIEMLKPVIRDVNLFKRYIDAFSRARVNTIIFAHEPRQVSAWKRGKDEGWWTKSQISEIAAYAKKREMDVWAGMINKFDSRDFPELNLKNGTNIYDPAKGQSYEILFSLYEQILDAYDPSSFLIGHDEIKGLLLFSTKPDVLFAQSINTIHAWLSNKGVETVVFGDMLLEKELWDSLVGSANSSNSFYNSGPTHLAIDKIAKDIKIIDWHYSNKQTYPSLKYFRDHGFKVMGASWHDPFAAKSLVESIHSYDAQGIVGMDYGFWSTLSPAATTLYAPLCGWSSNCQISGNDDDVFALAALLQEGVNGNDKRQKTFVMLDLESNRSTFDRVAGDGQGIFGLGAFVDLRGLNDGKQVVDGISLSVTSRCAVTGVTRVGTADPALCFPVSTESIRADALVFLHTCYIDEPSFNPVKIGNYIVEYENGQKINIDIVAGYNITDVRSSQGLRQNSWKFTRSPDTLSSSRRVWRGRSATGVPLNVQMMTWKNPYPTLQIKGIQLCSKKLNVTNKIALLAVTSIKYGQVK